MELISKLINYDYMISRYIYKLHKQILLIFIRIKIVIYQKVIKKKNFVDFPIWFSLKKVVKYS